MFWRLIEYVIESNFITRCTEKFALLLGQEWHVKTSEYSFFSLCVNSYKARNEITVFVTYCCNRTGELYTLIVCLLICLVKNRDL